VRKMYAQKLSNLFSEGTMALPCRSVAGGDARPGRRQSVTGGSHAGSGLAHGRAPGRISLSVFRPPVGLTHSSCYVLSVEGK
jgi:hypothetical protein